MNLVQEIKLNYVQSHLESIIQDDEIPYVSQESQDQLERIDDYIFGAKRACEMAASGSFRPKKLFASKESTKALTFANLYLLELTDTYRPLLFEKLASLVINGKPVTLFYPQTADDKYDVGLRWD